MSTQLNKLIADIKGYIDHVAQHTAKENYRVFMTADMFLRGKADQFSKNLGKPEEEK
jgi:hemerythrin-like domain-containing protein